MPTDKDLDKAAELRLKAIEMIEEAIKLDGVRPRFVIHESKDCVQIHVIWKSREIDMVDAFGIFDIDYEFDAEKESLTVVNDSIVDLTGWYSTPHCEIPF